MTLYRKKPCIIEAMRWMPGHETMDGHYPYPDWLKKEMVMHEGRVGVERLGQELRIYTLEGTMVAKPGDWVIKGTHGELYPVKDEIFTSIYEAVL